MTAKKKSVIGEVFSDIGKTDIVRIAKASFTAWYRRWPLVIVSTIVDFIFLLMLSTAAYLVQLKLFEKMDALMEITGQKAGLMDIYGQQVTQASQALFGNPEVQMITTAMVKYLFYLVLASFFICIVFQGLNFFIAHRMSAKNAKQSFLVYMRNFALETIPFYVLHTVWVFFTILLMFRLRTGGSTLGDGFSYVLFAVLTAVTWYFGIICYTITNRSPLKNLKESFIAGIKKFPKLIQTFAFLFVIFIILNIIYNFIFYGRSAGWELFGGLVLLLPFIAYARIMLFKTRQLYWPLKRG